LIEIAMPQKIERILRDRPVTPEEVAKDERIRAAVQSEFPPALKSSGSCPLSDALRNAIRQSAQSAEEIAEKAKVSSLVVSRFLSGERDNHLETAGRLAEVLGVKLTANA
jgi:ribosome-binding protein aMBF1 (putative translation factor)